MKIADCILADSTELPPLGEALYQYVVAGNGLFIRAEDSRLRALVQIAPAQLTGLLDLVECAELKIPRVPGRWLHAILASAIRHMPNEAMYQFLWNGYAWRCIMPGQAQTPTALSFADDGQAVIDLHSHNSMSAFFSTTDDADEQGLRFYAVIGKIETWQPELRVRIGIYGHFLDIPADMIFDDLGPFTDRLGEDMESDDMEQADDQPGRLLHLLQTGWA